MKSVTIRFTAPEGYNRREASRFLAAMRDYDSRGANWHEVLSKLIAVDCAYAARRCDEVLSKLEAADEVLTTEAMLSAELDKVLSPEAVKTAAGS